MRPAPQYGSADGTIPSDPRRGSPQHVETTSTLAERLDQLGIIRYSEWWRESRNGTYAMLAIRLLSAEPTLSKSRLWSRIQHVVRREIGAEPAKSDQGGPTLVFLLWQLGLIVAGAR